MALWLADSHKLINVGGAACRGDLWAFRRLSADHITAGRTCSCAPGNTCDALLLSGRGTTREGTLHTPPVAKSFPSPQPWHPSHTGTQHLPIESERTKVSVLTAARSIRWHGALTWHNKRSHSHESRFKLDSGIWISRLLGLFPAGRISVGCQDLDTVSFLVTNATP